MEISVGEISAFRLGVRRHRADGCASMVMSDCCLRAGIASALDYKNGELVKLITPPPKAVRCPYTEQFGGKIFACAEDSGHDGDHALVAGWTGP